MLILHDDAEPHVLLFNYTIQGHTMEVTGVAWHPIDKNLVLTSSLDGSVRIWDLLGESTFGNLCSKHVRKSCHPSLVNHLKYCIHSKIDTIMIHSSMVHVDSFFCTPGPKN